MTKAQEFELLLIRSEDDALPFSEEYQNELREFSRGAMAKSQRAFAMDGADGGGGPLGEFIFGHADVLIAALSALAGAWINGKLGRKLRLKVGEIEIEANTAEEIDVMIKKIQALQKVKPNQKSS